MVFRHAIALICAAILLGSAGVVPGSAEESCTPTTSRRLFRQFIVAYNEGNLKRLDFIFPSQRDFGMYRVSPERTGPTAEDRSSLKAYLRERIAHNDALEIRRFRASSERSPDGSCGISFVLERTSDDPLPWGNGTFTGKGGIKPENDRYMWAINMGWLP